MDLSRFPRVRAAHLPTPLEALDRLSEALGGPRIWIKRDDCTGLATGGNKSRKLEFLVAEALRQGADTLITAGATQSNHVRQTAAIAGRFGLACHVVLEDRAKSQDASFNENGNVLLDRLFGAAIEVVPGGTDVDAAMAARAVVLRKAGARPYVIPVGGSNPVGALGYVNAALELDLTVDQVVHATGSSGTQAGLIVGFAAADRPVPVLGVSVSRPREVQEPQVLELAQATAAHVGLGRAIRAEEVAVDSGHYGPGYGIPTPGMVEAVKMVARMEGILLDPVYAGKAMAGLIDRTRRGLLTDARNVVFWHTGGSAALFGYPGAFELA